MMRIKIILILMLAFLLGGQGAVVYAQVKGSPVNSVNAIDYRYQQFNGTLPSFADSVKFRDRSYNVIGAGAVYDWEQKDDAMSQMSGWSTRVAYGYKYTPVHATEVDFTLGGNSKGHFFGADLNYVMNLNNFASRRDGKNKVEAYFIAGLSYRYAQDHAYGLNSGLRLQWNFRTNTGLFIEPKVNVLTSEGQGRLFTTQPYLSAGLVIRYHKVEYTIVDYLSDLIASIDNTAIKTNLLYDLAAVPNLGLEFNLGNNFSIATDWMYAWWNKDSIGWYWRTYGGELAIRKWFGKKSQDRLFTGHHIGLYGQCLTYDIALNGHGQIGGGSEEALWGKANYGAGLEYGYSVPVSKRLNFDFSVGVGYFGGQYQEYVAEDNCYVWQSTKQRHWIGPTKAEISLVYLIGKTADNKNKGGRK